MKLITVAVPCAMTKATRCRPRRVVEQVQEQMVESDLHDEGQAVERPDRDEAGRARRRLKRPPPVDQVGGDSAGNEADGLGQIGLQTHSLYSSTDTGRSRRSPRDRR